MHWRQLCAVRLAFKQRVSYPLITELVGLILKALTGLVKDVVANTQSLTGKLPSRTHASCHPPHHVPTRENGLFVEGHCPTNHPLQWLDHQAVHSRTEGVYKVGYRAGQHAVHPHFHKGVHGAKLRLELFQHSHIVDGVIGNDGTPCYIHNHVS